MTNPISRAWNSYETVMSNAWTGKTYKDTNLSRLARFALLFTCGSPAMFKWSTCKVVDLTKNLLKDSTAKKVDSIAQSTRSSKTQTTRASKALTIDSLLQNHIVHSGNCKKFLLELLKKESNFSKLKPIEQNQIFSKILNGASLINPPVKKSPYAIKQTQDEIIYGENNEKEIAKLSKKDYQEILTQAETFGNNRIIALLQERIEKDFPNSQP